MTVRREESALERLERIEAEERAAGRRETPAASTTSERAGAGGGLLAVLAILLTKGKLLLGALKLGPMLMTLSTMGLALVTYAQFYGWQLALGFLLLVLLHECGHGVAAKLLGLRVGAPVFIPFFGAVIALKDQPRSTWMECVVGLGGPLAGLLGCVLVLLIGLTHEPGTGRDFWIVLAWLTASINFFNLMPVFGLDGDRISQPLRPWHWVVVCAFVFGLIAVSQEAIGRVDPFVLFILVLGAVKGVRVWRSERRGTQPPERLVDRLTSRTKYVDEGQVTDHQRRVALATYLVLAGGLCAVMLHTQVNLHATLGR